MPISFRHSRRTLLSTAGFGFLLLLMAVLPAHAATGLDRLVRQVEADPARILFGNRHKGVETD